MIVFSWQELLQIRDPKSPHHGYFKNGSAITIGGFDGPHQAHEVLFNAVLAQKKVKRGVITFARPPAAISHPEKFSGDVATIRMRLETFQTYGFDFTVVIDFSSDFSKIKGKDFLLFLKDVCFMKFLAVGSDFRCGKGLDTGVTEIQVFCEQFEIAVSVLDVILISGYRMSSTAVRNAISVGNMAAAKNLLGHPYNLDCVGFDWKLDTATNCLFHSKTETMITQLLPPEGCYRVNVVFTDCEERETYLFVESNFLRLEIPQKTNFPDLESFKFISFIQRIK